MQVVNILSDDAYVVLFLKTLYELVSLIRLGSIELLAEVIVEIRLFNQFLLEPLHELKLLQIN